MKAVLTLKSLYAGICWSFKMILDQNLALLQMNQPPTLTFTYLYLPLFLNTAQKCSGIQGWLSTTVLSESAKLQDGYRNLHKVIPSASWFSGDLDLHFGSKIVLPVQCWTLSSDSAWKGLSLPNWEQWSSNHLATHVKGENCREKDQGNLFY